MSFAETVGQKPSLAEEADIGLDVSYQDNVHRSPPRPSDVALDPIEPRWALPIVATGADVSLYPGAPGSGQGSGRASPMSPVAVPPRLWLRPLTSTAGEDPADGFADGWTTRGGCSFHGSAQMESLGATSRLPTAASRCPTAAPKGLMASLSRQASRAPPRTAPIRVTGSTSASATARGLGAVDRLRTAGTRSLTSRGRTPGGVQNGGLGQPAQIWTMESERLDPALDHQASLTRPGTVGPMAVLPETLRVELSRRACGIIRGSGHQPSQEKRHAGDLALALELASQIRTADALKNHFERRLVETPL